MRLKFLFFGVLGACSLQVFSQTLFVPSGTGGIGNSSTANVGIGISNPAEKLVINGAIRGNQSGALRVSSGFGYIDIGPKNSSFAHFYTDRPLYYFDKEIRVNSGNIGSFSGNLYLRTAGVTRLTIESGGTSRFNGSIYVPINSNIVIGATVNQDTYRLRLHHSGIHGYVDYMDNLHFRANKNWISALTLYGNGSVGVGFGTTYEVGHYKNQGYKFAVNGGIICEEVKVITDVPDADYVFQNDYKLSSLSEVERFIQENKHLPNIPSAEQFKANGYKVGEMDEMLLRKIEEITLYLIEQNKRIVILEEENRQLRAKKRN